jgi:hypothetical protein
MRTMKKKGIFTWSEMEVHYCDVGIVMIINFQFVCIEDVPLESSSMDGKNVAKDDLI